MDKLSPNELSDYNAMRYKQQHKPILKSNANKNKPLTETDLITQAYIHHLCLCKGIALTEPVKVNEQTKKVIHQLYLGGVLPVRLGGINIE